MQSTPPVCPPFLWSGSSLASHHCCYWLICYFHLWVGLLVVYSVGVSKQHNMTKTQLKTCNEHVMSFTTILPKKTNARVTLHILFLIIYQITYDIMFSHYTIRPNQKPNLPLCHHHSLPCDLTDSGRCSKKLTSRNMLSDLSKVFQSQKVTKRPSLLLNRDK